MDCRMPLPVHQTLISRDVYCVPRTELSRIRLNSDAGSQYTSIRYTDTLALEGLQPSIGSVGDAYDNAAAETVMGLFKNEAVAKDSPFRSGALKTETDVMEIVFEWVHWYNNERLHSALDHQTPEEFEQT
ncbi:transposase [Pseudarthrobacter cellobiosi]|uniref:transposase n=1 Tax=Pseudarthrobacter cellobiosi TaxID=2953654 RepID=UPI0035ABD4B3